MCASKFVEAVTALSTGHFVCLYGSENHIYAYRFKTCFLLGLQTTSPAQAGSLQLPPKQPVHCHSCPFQPLLHSVAAVLFRKSDHVTSLVNKYPFPTFHFTFNIQIPRSVRPSLIWSTPTSPTSSLTLFQLFPVPVPCWFLSQGLCTFRFLCQECSSSPAASHPFPPFSFSCALPRPPSLKWLPPPVTACLHCLPL